MIDNSQTDTRTSHDPLCNSYKGCGSGMECPCFVNENSCVCECELIAKVRAEYVNRECVWGEGECVPDCPSCRRMDEMLKERAAGDREGQRLMLEKCIDTLKNISVQI